MTGKRRQSQKKFTDLAKGRKCEIRVPGVCNFNPETTVPCHYRLAGLAGLAFIPPVFMFAFGCSACHTYCDTHHDDSTRLMHAEGCFRTLAALKRMGISIPGDLDAAAGGEG